jgi:hypothetical protein
MSSERRRRRAACRWSHRAAAESRMLKSAAVGAHGRGLPGRLLTCGLLLILFTPRSTAAQPASPSVFDDLLPELVAKIASALSGSVPVTITVAAGENVEDAPAIRARMTTLFASRGIQTADAGAASTAVAIGCGRNLRERVCVARILSDGRDQIATVTRRLTSATPVSPTASLALELRPLFSQQTQILDVAVIGDRLLVLDVAALGSFERKDGAWRGVLSRPLPLSRPWPRDPRGRVRVEGNRFDLFLPAMTCSGRTDTSELTCKDGQQPWPIGADNRGLEPGRNYFKSPEGKVFYNAAPLDAGADDDAIALTAACATGTYVAAVSPSGRLDAGDLLQLSRVTGDRLTVAASPLVLPGVLTALWAHPDQTSAVVVTHDARGGRYDAFQTTISCSR